MADPSLSSELTPAAERFGAGLTEAEVRRLQRILRVQTGVEVTLPEAWSRAIAVLSLVEMLLQDGGVWPAVGESSTKFAYPRS